LYSSRILRFEVGEKRLGVCHPFLYIKVYYDEALLLLLLLLLQLLFHPVEDRGLPYSPVSDKRETRLNTGVGKIRGQFVYDCFPIYEKFRRRWVFLRTINFRSERN
jgi:hypothetical protein